MCIKQHKPLYCAVNSYSRRRCTQRPLSSEDELDEETYYPPKRFPSPFKQKSKGKYLHLPKAPHVPDFNIQPMEEERAADRSRTVTHTSSPQTGY